MSMGSSRKSQSGKPRQGGRPRVAPHQKRTICLQMYVTPDEAEAYYSVSLREGRSLSDILRDFSQTLIVSSVSSLSSR